MKLTGKSIAIVSLVLLTFMATGCSKENADEQIRSKVEQEQSQDNSEQEDAASESVSATEEPVDETMPVEEEAADEVVGWVLIGNQGSGITLYNDGKADYYWIEKGLMEEDASWSGEDNTITIYLSVLMCDIYAVYEGEGKPFVFKSDSANWDEEVFIPVGTTKNKLLADDYKKLMEKVYEAIAKSATGENGGEESEVQQPSEEASESIRPEIKEFLDSYEAFMDEYCEFMKKYADSDNPISMLNDYSKIMLKYMEFGEKFKRVRNSGYECRGDEILYRGYTEGITEIS